MTDLKDIRVFLLDMDGTFYLGSRILPSSMEFVHKMNETGRRFVFLTNNSSRNRADYAAKLRGMGYECPEDNIITSGEAATIYLKRKKPGARIYLVGTPSLEKEFADEGFVLVDKAPDCVVLGFDTTLTYEKLWRLCDFVRGGVPYIATHPDFNCPLENGYMPDIGAMMAFVKASTGREADVIVGKPYEHIVQAVMDKLGVDKRQVAMVGDRLYTDIAMGVNSGITSILVLSGETTRGDLKASSVQPDYVFKHLGDLAGML